jgi:hypothetical protein
VGCPIRKSTDQSLFAAPHGLSQRITSFIACACQGIHQMPLYHLIILIANAHHSSVRSRRSPCGDRLHSARTAKQSDGLAAYAWLIRRWACFSRSVVVEWRVLCQERSVIGDVFSFPNEARASSGSSTANTRDVRSFSCPAAVLCANPIWRRDWRKTSFLRRSPMPRGQAWQSKQGNPFQPHVSRLLAKLPAKAVG